MWFFFFYKIAPQSQKYIEEETFAVEKNTGIVVKNMYNNTVDQISFTD